MAFSYNYIDTKSSTTDVAASGNYTFSGYAWVAPAAGRKILAVVFVGSSSGNVGYPSSVTIGGIAATLSYSATQTDGNDSRNIGFYMADVPVGTSGDVIVTVAQAKIRAACAVYELFDLGANTPDDTFASNAAASGTIDVAAGGAIFACAHFKSGTAHRWRSGDHQDTGLGEINRSIQLTNAGGTGLTARTIQVMESSLGSLANLYAVSYGAIKPAGLYEITPSVGPSVGGTSVTLSGFGFLTATNVEFDGSSCANFAVVDDNTITCDTPAHAAGLVDVVVIRPTTNLTLEDGFAYSDIPSPSFTSITPNFGHTTGGTAVTIIGDNFTGVTDVKFGGAILGVSATNLVVVDDETMTMETPAHADGLVDIYIIHPGNGNTLVENAFDYRPFNRVTQTPMLMVDLPKQENCITQAAVLIVNEPVQGAKITQAPTLFAFHTTPIPLPAPIWPEVPVTEVWQYRTIINAAERGKEQRSALRAAPRINMRFSALIMNGAERRDVYQLLMKYIHRVFNYPLYSHATLVSAVSIAGTTKLYFDPAATDMRAGEAIALIDAQTMQTVLVTLASVDVDGGNTAEPLPVTVWGHWYVAPAPEFRPTPTMLLEMNAIDGEFSLSLLGTQARTVKRPNQSNGLLTTVDGMLLLDKRPLADDAVDEEFDQNVTWLDNNVAPPVPRTNWPVAYASGERQFLVHRPSDMDYWRAVADNLRGRQKAFLLPTFRDDLPLYEVPALGATEIKTSNVQFFDFWRSKAWRYIRIQSSAGVIYRKINEVIDHYDPSGQPLYLTIKLAASIGAGAGANANMMVSYVNTCRLDSDEIVMRHGPVDTVLTIKVRMVDEEYEEITSEFAYTRVDEDGNLRVSEMGIARELE